MLLWQFTQTHSLYAPSCPCRLWRLRSCLKQPPGTAQQLRSCHLRWLQALPKRPVIPCRDTTSTSDFKMHQSELFGASQKDGFRKGGFGRCSLVPDFIQKVFPCSATLAEESYDFSYSLLLSVPQSRVTDFLCRFFGVFSLSAPTD